MSTFIVEYQNSQIFIIGRISVHTGTVDGKFSSWLELEGKDAELLAETILRLIREEKENDTPLVPGKD